MPEMTETTLAAILSISAEASVRGQCVFATVSSDDGSALVFLGDHSKSTFCWCQPAITVSRGRKGRETVTSTHRRTLDETFAQSDARLGDDTPGWSVQRRGRLILPEGRGPRVSPGALPD